MTVPLYRARCWSQFGGAHAGHGLSLSPVRRRRQAQGPVPATPPRTALALFTPEGGLTMFPHVASPAAFPDGARSTAGPRLPPGRRARQLTLAPDPAAVPQGRQAVQETLRAWKLDAVADTAALLASELLTNAVKATSAAAPAPGGGERLTLTLQCTGPGVLVEVWDQNPAPAIPQTPGLTDECGRGLLLVETLSSTWGQRTADGGKIVWCEITVPGTVETGS